MKIPISFLLAVLGISSFTAAAIYAQSKRGDYTPANSSNLNQHAPRMQREGPVYSVPFYPLSHASLAPGENRELVESYCGTCHSTIYITMQPPLPAATWEAVVNKMIRTFGQPIPQDAATKIIAYLQTHYTPETRKKQEPISHSLGAGNRKTPSRRKSLAPK